MASANAVLPDAEMPPAPMTLEDVVAIAAMHAESVDADARFPREAVDALKAAGLLGAMIPVRLGGGGATIAEIARQCNKLARACSSTAMIYAMHQIQVACVVNHALEDRWHREFAQRVAAEQLLLASITSEVGVGGDMRSSLCAVEISDGQAIVRKDAPTVSYGAQADVFLITMRALSDSPASDQVLVTMLREQADLEPTSGWDAMGMRGTCSGGFRFKAQGAAEQVLPVPFAEISADSMVPVSHLLWSSVWMGIAAEALTRARKCLRVQAQQKPGVALPGAGRLTHANGLLDMIQARLQMLIKRYDESFALGSGRETRDAFPAGFVRASTLNSLKIDVSTACHEVAMEAMRICGMPGYKNGTEFSVGRQLRDILSAQLMISNDRIAASTGNLLLAQRGELGGL